MSLLYSLSTQLIYFTAVQKNIEFGYLRTKWEIEADHPMTFDNDYLEDENRSELYVFLAADATDAVPITVGTKNKKATTLFSDVAEALIKANNELKFTAPVLFWFGRKCGLFKFLYEDGH